MRRGDVVVVALPGDLGKPRPAVVVQVDLLNLHLGTVVLCPLSSFSSDPSLFRVAIEPAPENGLRLRSEIMVDKIQSANVGRVGQIVGRLSGEDVRRLDRALMLVLGLVPPSR